MQAATRYTVLLLAGLLLTAGCAKKKEAGANGGADSAEKARMERSAELEQTAEQAGIPQLKGGEIPGNTPVWPAGTSYSKEVRDQVILARTQGLDAFYRRAMETYGDTLRGMFTLRFTIYPDGTIGPVQVVDESWNVPQGKALTDSMVVRVQQWTFPPGLEKPVTFTQPWKFEK